jgi:hypothetical protein
VQVDSIKNRVESALGVCNQRLKLKCDEPLLNFASNFSLRRYNKGYLRGSCSSLVRRHGNLHGHAVDLRRAAFWLLGARHSIRD